MYDSSREASQSELRCQPVGHLLFPLLFEHQAQAASEGGGERRGHSIADLPVPVVDVAGKLEVVGEALRERWREFRL